MGWLAAATARTAAAVSATVVVASIAPAVASAARLRIPGSARQLVVVSSPTADPSGNQSIATLRAYARAGRGAAWRLVFGAWPTETGSGHLVAAARRREGDHATPIGVFGFGHTVYGAEPDPGGLHYPYHRLVCGDWWDEDPYSSLYNRFVHVPCGVTPGFRPGSEALWTERLAYPYFVLLDFNIGPIRRGSGATGSAIFLHGWVYSATAGCVALPVSRLLAILRWLRPSQHPVVEIGPDAELAPIR